MLIEWDKSLDIEIAEINEQHKRLIRLINELHDAMLTGKSRDIMSSILEELKDYTVTHFSTEERYFDRFRYSRTDEHKLEHSTFVAKVTKFFDDFNNKKSNVSVDLMDFLKDWLIKHIKGSDMKYKELFKNNGL